MASANGQATDPLMAKLKSSPQMFDFFAAVRHIQSHFQEKSRIGRSLAPSQDPVRCRQSPFLEFAPSTIEADQVREDKPTVLFSRPIGMFGANGRLPLYLTEYARDRILYHGDKNFTVFCNVFHHRLISYFFRAWADARKTDDYVRPGDQNWVDYVCLLRGMRM